MHRGAAFGDILAEKLRDVHVECASPAAVRAGFGPDAGPVILDGEPRIHFSATPYGRMAGATRRQAGHASFGPPYAPSASVPATAAPSRAPRRMLSPRHQRALDAFVGFGAALHADFTEAELRSAFRSLARRYHPDRHPGSSLAESGRLARVFARLAEDYRELLALTREPILVN